MTGEAAAAGGQVPLVLALDDPGAVAEVVGGKGASLSRLARAGFRVPPGFHVTTGAYLDFLDGGGLRDRVLAALSLVDVSDAATSEAAAAGIGELFAGQPVPASTAAAVAGAYASLGDDDVPVAVRSSATVEDLSGMSAAGQHDTYLNVRGEAAVIDAVRRCWASLWSARAIGYRARRGISPGEVSIAVVVQRLVRRPRRPASCSPSTRSAALPTRSSSARTGVSASPSCPATSPRTSPSSTGRRGRWSATSRAARRS